MCYYNNMYLFLWCCFVMLLLFKFNVGKVIRKVLLEPFLRLLRNVTNLPQNKKKYNVTVNVK